MDEWVEKALAKWPNVPALFGWLGLTRRGRWLIKGEAITHPKIVQTIARNYGADEHGRWYFQNGPQRGYIALEYAPLVLHSLPDGGLQAHTGKVIEAASAAYLDEQGSFIIDTNLGAGLVNHQDLDWVLARLVGAADEVSEAELEQALALPSGQPTALRLRALGAELPVARCDEADLPVRLGFARDPQPLPGEKAN